MLLSQDSHRWLGNHRGDIAAEARDLSDEPRSEERPRRGGRNEQRVHTGDRLVHLRHLQFGLEVGYGSEPFDNEVGFELLGEIDDQGREHRDRHIREVIERLDEERLRQVIARTNEQ